MATGWSDAASSPVPESEREVWDHWGVEPQERYLDLDPPLGRIRVEEAGQGHPVLMIHGTGGYGPYWGPLVAKLEGYRLLMLDRPGWGGSDPVDFPQSGYRDFVADLLVGVLDGLGVEKAHAVGASIGDTWALALATNHPERVHSVTLLGGGPLTDEIKVPPPIKALGSPLGALMSRMPWRDRMERFQARGSGHGPALDDGRMPQVYVDWKVGMTNNTEWRIHERNMVRTLVGRGGWTPGLTFDEAELSSLSMPILMVYGTADQISGIETWQAFTARMPQGRLEAVEQAGHLPWFDEPEEVAGLLRDHFQSATR